MTDLPPIIGHLAVFVVVLPLMVWARARQMGSLRAVVRVIKRTCREQPHN